MKRIAALLAISAATLAVPVYAAEHNHEHHQAMSGASSSNTPLTAPGNDAFAAIQEAVGQLLADPNTDWSRVNLEGLRQHLRDMQNFTFNVEVTAQKPIDGGVEFTVKPTTPGAAASLGRLFSAHPMILKQESGWDMKTKKNADGSTTARVTSAKAEDAVKIRGLGYIGLIAYGKHHQLHHWLMATGNNPHKH